jgi:RimJ/RimL family protein N-acetyltransferase
VRPESRRQGIASTAVRRMTRWAHEQGLRRVWLEIDPVNAASLGVAERAGYRFEERLPCTAGTGGPTIRRSTSGTTV